MKIGQPCITLPLLQPLLQHHIYGRWRPCLQLLKVQIYLQMNKTSTLLTIHHLLLQNCMTKDVFNQLQKISVQQSKIKSVKSRLSVYQDVANKHAETFAELQLVKRVPVAYRHCLAECMRRFAFQPWNSTHIHLVCKHVLLRADLSQTLLHFNKRLCGVLWNISFGPRMHVLLVLSTCTFGLQQVSFLQPFSTGPVSLDIGPFTTSCLPSQGCWDYWV